MFSFPDYDTKLDRRRARYVRHGGFSLIEVIISLGVIAMAFFGLSGYVGNQVRNVANIRQDLTAANLAQEGVELVRNLRDDNWLAIHRIDSAGACPQKKVLGTWRQGLCGDLSTGTDYTVDVKGRWQLRGNGDPLLCLQADGTYAYSGCTAANRTRYRRTITMRTPSGASANHEMIVQSTVTWCPTVTAACLAPKSIVVEDRLFNWFSQ